MAAFMVSHDTSRALGGSLCSYLKGSGTLWTRVASRRLVGRDGICFGKLLSSWVWPEPLAWRDS